MSVTEGDHVAPAKYPQLMRFVADTPWAILPGTFATIRDLLAFRAAGGRLTPEEIEERIGVSAALGQQQEIPRGSVMVIPLRGVIVPRATMFSDVSGAATLEGFLADFRAAMAEPNVASILIDVDSPGGSTDLVPEAAAELRAARGKKPIVAVANTDCFSAAYWLAAQADEIVVTPSGGVGSVGVFAAHEDISGMEQMAGVKTTLIAAGKYKTEGNPFEPLTDEARAAIQGRVDEMYGLFVSDVAKGRGISVQDVIDGYGQGRPVMALEAKRAGMVDRVAPFGQTLQRLARGQTPARPSVRGADLAPSELAATVTPTASGLELVAGGTASSSAMSVTNVQPAAAYAVAPDDTTPEAETEDKNEGREALNQPPHEQPQRHLDDSKTQSSATSSTTRKEKQMATIEELIEERTGLAARLQEIDSMYVGERLPDHARQEFNDADGRIGEIDEIVADDAARKLRVQNAVEAGTVEKPARDKQARQVNGALGKTHVPRGVFNLAEYRRDNDHEDLPSAYREGAKRALEGASFPHPDAKRTEVLEHIHRVLDTSDASSGALAFRILATGSPTYMRAFGKQLSGAPLSSEETQALSLNAALSETGNQGGYAVPYVLDPTVVPTSNGDVNPIRQLASVETITGANAWKGVTSAGVTAHYRAEGAEVEDDAPTLAQPTITPERVDVFIPFSMEVGQDWGGLQATMARLIQDAKDTVEASKFINGLGHGSTEPEGLLVGATRVVLTAATATFARGDLDLLEAALGPRFIPRASMIASKTVFQKVRTFAAAGDQSAYNRLDAERPPLLIGYRAYEESQMTSALTSGSSILTIGDFSYYKVIDRVGMNIEVIPHLFGTVRNYPTGQRGLLAIWRNSAGVIDNNAFRTLKVR